MKKLIAGAALALASALGLSAPPQALAEQGAAAAKPAKKYRVVFHVSENDPQKWQLALNNAFAFQNNVGRDHSDLEIVAIGPGLNMLKLDSRVGDRIAQALDRDIDVVACGETMRNTKVSATDLIGGVRVVAGGLIEIVDRQHAGWVYIRP